MYKKIVEVKCRVVPALPGKCQLNNERWKKVIGSTGEKLFVIEEFYEEQLIDDLKKLREQGIESLAVILAHSYTLVDVFTKIEILLFGIFFKFHPKVD